MVRRRCEGDTLKAIGEDHGLTRERVRQITLKVAPWEPWEGIARAREVELRDIARQQELVLAAMSRRPCDVCGEAMYDPNPARRFCSPDCRTVWERLSYHTDPVRRAQAKRAQARYIVDNAERLGDTQVRFAERILSGDVDTDREYRWMVEGTTAFATAVEALIKGWPIAEDLPPSIQRQIYEHLGREWDGDPDVPSGSESLRDADWIGASQAEGRSPYAEQLTKEFLEEAYVEVGFSGSEIAELVGCASGTVYSALRRHGIPRRGSAVSLEDVLTEEYLTTEYVEAGRSAPSIAYEVGCDPSTIYSALRRHGIPTRGSEDGSTWRDVPELVEPEYLRREHIDEGKSVPELAAELSCARRDVVDALGHHGIARPDHGQPATYRHILTPEYLTQAYLEEGLSGNEIADRLGCHPTTVYEAMRRHGIKTSGQAAGRTRWESILTADFLRQSYVERGRSGGQIAEEVGCSPSVVYSWLDRHGIERREARDTRTGSSGTDWDPEWLREQYLVKGRSGADLAKELGVPAPTLYGALRRHGIRRS